MKDWEMKLSSHHSIIPFDGETFNENPSEFETTALRVTNKETNKETIYVQMNSAGAMLSPGFKFSHGHVFDNRVRSSAGINVFIFELSWFRLQENIVFTYRGRNVGLSFVPLSYGEEITNVRSTRVGFYLDASIPPLFANGSVSMRDTGLFYCGSLYISLDMLASAFDYVLPVDPVENIGD
jgi:hypothetical protein